ncbi:MAG: mechanosensitive ion channel family protein [Acidimicrobiia bacterium]|nr:mechanosensitive ion channel family protein [Acidimicrobiia bacterium]
MNSPFTDSNAAWAALIIVVVPLLIIGAGELEERLRQRDSRYQNSVAILRVWIVPLFTFWVLGRALFDIAEDNVFLRLLGSALVLAIALAVLSALRVIVAGLADRPRRGDRRPVPRLLLAMPRLLVILATGWFLIAGVWGIDLSAALTALGVTSLVISFALQDTLSGLASGFTLLADQPFAPGDWIESEDIEGRVIDVNWRSTRVQNRDGDLVVIPNGQLANATITNYDQPERLHRVKVPVQIERTAPPTAAIAMLVDAARSTPGVVEDPPPFARVTNIADPVVDYEASMWIDDYTNAPQVKADFGALVWYLSYRHDVPLPNPAQDLYLFDGAKTAIESQLTAADLRRHLLGSALLRSLDDDVLDRLAAAARLAQYQQGETIVAVGSYGGVMLLHSGRARIVLRHVDDPEAPDLDVLDIDGGEIFGTVEESAATDRTPLIVAVTDCDVVTIPPEAAAEAVSRSPDLSAALDQLGTTRRRRIERAIRRSGYGKALPAVVDSAPISPSGPDAGDEARGERS